MKEDQVKETFEKSVNLFALRSKNLYVREVLREFARSDDWVNLYRIDSYRHRHPQQMPRTMYLDQAQNLVGRVVEAWLKMVAQRPV